MATPATPTARPMKAAEMLRMGDTLVAAWNDHDVEAITALMTEDVVYSEPALPEIAHGKAAAAEALRNTFTAFPDFRVLPEEVHVCLNEELQMSIADWVITGTMTGPIEGIPATGRSCRVAGTTVSRLRDGQISEYTTHYDSLTMLQQLGILPSSEGLGFKALVTAQVMAGKARKALHRQRSPQE